MQSIHVHGLKLTSKTVSCLQPRLYAQRGHVVHQIRPTPIQCFVKGLHAAHRPGSSAKSSPQNDFVKPGSDPGSWAYSPEWFGEPIDGVHKHCYILLVFCLSFSSIASGTAEKSLYDFQETRDLIGVTILVRWFLSNNHNMAMGW